MNDHSEPNTHSEALAHNPSQDQPSTSDKSPKPKQHCSIADMAPLEFKKDCLLTLKRYPNLLKRYEEGKVKVHVSHTEEECLNSIRQKVISKTAFSKYLSETPDQTKTLPEPILLNTPGDADTTDDQSSGSSGEGDDSEIDSDYNPLKEVNDEDMPTKAKKPRTKDEGNKR